MTFYVNTERDPLQLASTMQSVVRDADANLPVYNLKTMDRVVEEDLFGARMVAVSIWQLRRTRSDAGSPRHLRSAFAFLVVQRTREIGIRMAVGAESGDIRMLIVKEVGSMLITGVVVGLPLAYVLARLSESLLFGVKGFKSVDLHARPGTGNPRRGGRLLRPGAPCDAGRSSGGAAVRIAETGFPRKNTPA